MTGTEEKARKVLEKLQPYLKEDGGGAEYVSFDDKTGVMKIRFTGECRTCPLSIMTLRAGIERIIKGELPEVTRLEKI